MYCQKTYISGKLKFRAKVLLGTSFTFLVIHEHRWWLWNAWSPFALPLELPYRRARISRHLTYYQLGEWKDFCLAYCGQSVAGKRIAVSFKHWCTNTSQLPVVHPYCQLAMATRWWNFHLDEMKTTQCTNPRWFVITSPTWMEWINVIDISVIILYEGNKRSGGWKYFLGW